jgi:sulfatase maturation enzyme AslB (radical SAM superfamily)
VKPTPQPPYLALRRKLRFARTRVRELRMIVWGLLSTRHPLLVHIIPIRRCNLACTYCNEFDDFSSPVPLDEMKRHNQRRRASVASRTG